MSKDSRKAIAEREEAKAKAQKAADKKAASKAIKDSGLHKGE